ncbi:unnamed protein product, partial [Closterium sp. Yama58-4]
MIDGSNKEGIGAANGSGDTDDYEDHTTPGFDWVWEVQELSAPSTATEESEEEKDKGEEGGDTSTKEADAEEAENSDEEESVDESASTSYSDPWRIIDTGDNEKAAAEIEDLLSDGAIIIGREVAGDSVGAEDNAAAEKGGAEKENEEMGQGKRVKKPNPNPLSPCPVRAHPRTHVCTLEGTQSLSLWPSRWLYNNSLTGAIPADIGSLTSMITLHLYSNMLSGSVPSSITKLTALMFLDISSNNLSGSIPAAISTLTQISRL